MQKSDSVLGQLISLDSQVSELATQLENLRYQNRKLKEALYQEFERKERIGFLKQLYTEYLSKKAF
jgi:seryl-tRNA synthetase